MTPEERCRLIDEVFQAAYRATDTFESPVGAGLAYLFHAIVAEDRVEYSEADDFISFLRDLFDVGHPVWGFVDIL